MTEEFCRSTLLLGEEGLQRLAAARVLLFGVGGVGGHVAEALARSGVGALTLVDKDVVSVSNLNRQIIALHSTVGQPKVEVMRRRILDISPHCQVTALQQFYLPENADTLPFEGYDFIVDAVDNVSAKLCIAQRAVRLGIPLISCMGTGNKLHAERLRLADISETRVCPLARVMRRELRRRGIQHLQVLYSDEEPLTPPRAQPPASEDRAISQLPKPIPGSVSFVPSVAGLLIAGEVVRRLALG